MSHYLTTIGLEIHLQLSTKTKAFCGCKNSFGGKPNTSVCPVCLGLPGSLPVLNSQYLSYAIKVALALSSNISDRMKFDRKNYFYPDLPKNYQISQYDMPLSLGGYVDIVRDDKPKRIGITRVHMEEDAGKLIHSKSRPSSYVDFNRTGTPLLEIVSEPDMSSPEEAYQYLTAVKSILKYLDVSDCNMEEGSLRCDANISIRPKGQKELGTKVELKNMNSFKGVRDALIYEEKRQARALLAGESIIQQTRLWNEQKQVSESMRTKEAAHDYRYFPDPDLLLFTIDAALVDEIRLTLPEMPEKKKERFIKDCGLSGYDASVLVSDRSMSNFFESCMKLYPESKTIVNWLTGDILKHLNANNLEFSDAKLTPQHLVGMLKLIDNNIISGKIAKEVLSDMLLTGNSADDIIQDKGLIQISDEGAIEKLACDVVNENPKVADDYFSGKTNALGFLVGQLMKKSKGKANPQLANLAIKKRLDRKRA